MVCQKPLPVAFRASRTIAHDETVDPKEFKKTKEEQRKNEWTAKRMHGQFAGDMKDKDKNSTWRWMIKSDLKGCTEALIYSAQEQSIRTNYIKYNIGKVKKETDYRFVNTRRYKSRSRNTREIEKYSLLKDKIARLWQMKKVAVIPTLVGALGTITTKFEKYIESLGIEIRTEHVQRSALIGTARIIRKIYFVKYLGKDIAVTSLTFG